MFVTAGLLLLHTHFELLLGEPPPSAIALLVACFIAKLLEILWLLQKNEGISERAAHLETGLSMVGMFALAGVLAVLTDRDDAPYFVLLAIPILQCAYHFGLALTLTTVVASIAMIFGWAIHFFALHPPPRPTEFLESGMISLIYALMGILVWSLVDQLRKKECLLYEQMSELESAHESLAREERLAAVGRLASGIAHEIRNPVAMIVSSLATASYPDPAPAERDEMFEIAKREAKRLEVLTTDFLSYARPSAPQRAPTSVAEMLHHVSNATRLRASEKGIHVESGIWDPIVANIDAVQVESALVNVCLNAVEATPEGGHIALRSRLNSDMLFIEIENTGAAIPEGSLPKIFEPFFTTRRGGTGLGLSIAKRVAEAHGGALWVSNNRNGSVILTLSIRVPGTSESE
jgi:signal transduction histidine kinase